MSEQTVIAWLDPGLTTGGAVYDITGNHFASGQYSYTGLKHWLHSVHHLHDGRLAIGWELYVQTPRPRPGSKAEYSNTAIAVIESFCQEKGIPTIKGQPSSARMVKSSVVFLRRLGWYREGQPHANDAACHLFRHLVRLKPVPEKIRAALPPGY